LKNAADSSLDLAVQAVAQAAGELENAPQGKGSLADIAMMKSDVEGLQTALAEVLPMIDGGEYAAATDRANSIRGNAENISAEVRAAQEKLAALQAAKPAKVRKN
jgi:hypothetical protein